MLQVHKIKENIYCFRGIERKEKDFHGPVFRTTEGSSYMAYLVIDDEITLIDTIDEHMTEEFKGALKEILEEREIDNIIINHVEPDHSYGYGEVKKLYPNAKTYCSYMAEEAMLEMFFDEHRYDVVEHLDSINTGRYNFVFVPTPFIHWPDNMITYLAEEKILFSNDAFGNLVTKDALYDDEYDYEGYLLRQCKEYYANIVMPCSRFVKNQLPEILDLNLEIDMVCPSHGIIWRKNIGKVIGQYLEWARFENIKDKIVIVYETIWDSTHIMAMEIAKGLRKQGIEVKVYRAMESRPSAIMTDLLDAKGILIGSSNFNNTMVPTIADILERIIALKPQNKVGMSFGSFGWADVHLSRIEDRLKEAEVELIEKPFYKKFRLNKDMKDYAEKIGEKISEKLRGRGE